jgi:hypothetical protein
MFDRDGRRYGSVSTDKIQELCQSGVITDETPVHSTLFDRWVPAGHVPALRPMLRQGAGASESLAALQGLSSRPLDDAEMNGSAPAGMGPGWWLFGLVLLGSASVGLVKFAMQHQLRIASEFAGAVFIGAWIKGLVWGLLAYGAFGRSRRAWRVGFTSGALLVALGALTFSGIVGFHAYQRYAMAHSEQQPTTAPATQPIPTPIVATANRSTPPATKPVQSSQSDVQKIAQFTETIRIELTDSRDRYVSTMRDLHRIKLIGAQNLTNRQNYAIAHRACEAAYAALNTVEKEQQSIVNGIPARVQALGVSQNAQQQFMTGFNQGRPSGEKYLQQSIALERQEIDELVALLKVLEPWANRLSVTNGRLVFPKKDLADSYNDHLRRIQSVITSEKQLIAQHQKDVQLQEGLWTSTVAAADLK